LSHAGDAENKSKEDPHKPPDDPVKNIVGPAFAALTGAILTGLALLTFHFADTIGWALAGLIWLVEVIFVGWLIANFIRYFEILGAGADSIGSRKRQAYAALRDDLQKGGRPAVLYSRWLPLFLDAIDRFFGDAGRNASAALDRCLSRPLSAACFDLSNRDDLYHMDHFRPCRPRRTRSAPKPASGCIAKIASDRGDRSLPIRNLGCRAHERAETFRLHPCLHRWFRSRYCPLGRWGHASGHYGPHRKRASTS
jgi:hypothetical protein